MENSKVSAEIMAESVKNATSGNPRLITAGVEATKKESQKLFKTV
jgi:hypothetical protein